MFVIFIYCTVFIYSLYCCPEGEVQRGRRVAQGHTGSVYLYTLYSVLSGLKEKYKELVELLRDTQVRYIYILYCVYLLSIRLT